MALKQNVRCEVPPGGPPRLVPLLPTEAEDPQTTPTPEPAPAPNVPQPAPPAPEEINDKGFRYHPPGDLVPQDAGRGHKDRMVWLPEIIFPLKIDDRQHAFLNSQIWGYGGYGWGGKGAPGGGECDPRNYDPLAQRDNYCEVRGHSMPLCPAGVGHQGQDIRPPSCRDNKWQVVAVVDGVIDMVSRNPTVRIKGKDGTLYRYMHMHPKSITVRLGQRVKQGDVLGRVSRYMGGKIQTTKHLHFDVYKRVRQKSGSVRGVYVPVYSSLIAAYRKAKGIEPGIDANGNLIPDHRFEIGVAPPQPEPPQPEPPQPEPPQPEPPQPEPPQPEPPQPEPPQPESPQPEPPQPEPPQPEPPQPEPPQPEPPQLEPPQTEDKTWWEWTRDTAGSWWDSAKRWWER